MVLIVGCESHLSQLQNTTRILQKNLKEQRRQKHHPDRVLQVVMERKLYDFSIPLDGILQIDS
ncbi:unnamed protein product [Brugia pahangi]|uniref:Ovule protein n=1 Tax=Brugia pahangi TaxID=6280 RepID=A0A0N4TS61_BRUPA|nr:unnamed protein product [Brugia pahangi]